MSLSSFHIHLHAEKSNGTHITVFDKLLNSTILHNLETGIETTAVSAIHDVAIMLINEVEQFVEKEFHVTLPPIENI